MFVCEMHSINTQLDSEKEQKILIRKWSFIDLPAVSWLCADM